MISSEVNPTNVNVTKAVDIPTGPIQDNMIGLKVENSEPRGDWKNQHRNKKSKQWEP